MRQGPKSEVWVRARITEHFLGTRHGLSPVEIFPFNPLKQPYEVIVLLQGPCQPFPLSQEPYTVSRVTEAFAGD